MDPLYKLKKARSFLLINHPFYGSLALKLILKEDSSYTSFWTDGKFIGYNPDFVLKSSLEENAAMLMHEVLHCALLHFVRENGRNHEKWNAACDYAINPIVLNSGLSLPIQTLYKEEFENLSAEVIYNLLPDGPYQNQGGEVRSGGSQQNQNQGNQDQAEKEKARNWKVAITQAATMAKARGMLPGGLERLIQETIQPKISWASVLRDFVCKATRNDYSFLKPNTRYLHTGALLPSLYSKELDGVVIAIDTSGSIDDEELATFGSECSSILSEFITKITIMYCDTKIQATEEISSFDLPLKLKAPGGGGTDFRPVFDWIEEQGISPTCLIYLTDLDGKFPTSHPDYPVIWVFTESMLRGNPPFGTSIKIN